MAIINKYSQKAEQHLVVKISSQEPAPVDTEYQAGYKECYSIEREDASNRKEAGIPGGLPNFEALSRIAASIRSANLRDPESWRRGCEKGSLEGWEAGWNYVRKPVTRKTEDHLIANSEIGLHSTTKKMTRPEGVHLEILTHTMYVCEKGLGSIGNKKAYWKGDFWFEENSRFKLISSLEMYGPEEQSCLSRGEKGCFPTDIFEFAESPDGHLPEYRGAYKISPQGDRVTFHFDDNFPFQVEGRPSEDGTSFMDLVVTSSGRVNYKNNDETRSYDVTSIAPISFVARCRF